MRQRAIPPEAVGVAVLTLHNIAVHRVLPAPADAALNLATAFGLTAFAGRVGCSRADLGIRAEDLSSGLRTGLCAAATAADGVAVGAALPATRRFFDDRRVTDVGRAEAVYHLALRIPLATAWHVLPTIDHYQGNAASALVADVGRGRRLAVLAAMLSTTGAGGVFAWLRLRSHSVLAPILAHAAVNM